MDLLNLAPDIQDVILNLPAIAAGDDPIHERQLRPIVAVLDWGKQSRMWRRADYSDNGSGWPSGMCFQNNLTN
jgi:hypothetical protein